MAKKIVPQEPCVFCGQNPCVCDTPTSKLVADKITAGEFDCGALGPDCECHDEPMRCTRQKFHQPSNAHYNLPHRRNWQKVREA